MTTRLILLLAAVLCWAAPLQGQTIKAVAFNTTNNTVASTNQIVFTRLATLGGTVADPSFAVISGTNTIGLFASSVIGIGPFLGFSYNGTRVFLISSNAIRAENPITFNNTTNAATTRTNLGLGLIALTNTSNVTAMRELAGSTNTNEPFSGSISVVGTNNTNTLVFSNGILLSQ
jgi:hypothetical protein